MIGAFPLLKEGSSIGSMIREKYLDRPLSSPRPFPTTFKRSILRRIDCLELIYRSFAPSSIPDVLSLTRYLKRKYFFNVNNLINIAVSLNPPGCKTRLLEGSWGRLFPTRTSPEPEISVQGAHPYGRQKNAPGLIMGQSKVGRLKEREEPSDPGCKSLAVFQTSVFQRGIAISCDESGGTAGQGNVYRREANKWTSAGSDGRSRMIPIFHRLHKDSPHDERHPDTSRVISGTRTRPGFGGINRSGTNRSDGRRSTIVTMPPIDLLHKDRPRDERSRDERHPDTSRIISGTRTRPGFGGINRSGTNRSDDRRSAIVTIPPIDLLRKYRPRDEKSQDLRSQDERLLDTSSVIFSTGTRQGFEWINRSGTTGSAGRMTTFVPEALATIRGISSKSFGIFGISSAAGADLEMMDRPRLIVHWGPPSMRWPTLSLSRGGDPGGVKPQISKPGSGNLPSLDFAEDLRRNVSGRNSAASDPRMTGRSYPELEQIEPVETKIIREVDLLREKKSVPDLDKRSIDLNLDRISDQVYSMIERRIRTERERRGLYG